MKLGQAGKHLESGNQANEEFFSTKNRTHTHTLRHKHTRARSDRWGPQASQVTAAFQAGNAANGHCEKKEGKRREKTKIKTQVEASHTQTNNTCDRQAHGSFQDDAPPGDHAAPRVYHILHSRHMQAPGVQVYTHTHAHTRTHTHAHAAEHPSHLHQVHKRNHLPYLPSCRHLRTKSPVFLVAKMFDS